MSNRPSGSDADEWRLFLSESLNNRRGLTYIAAQIAEALDQAQERGRQLYILAHETGAENIPTEMTLIIVPIIRDGISKGRPPREIATNVFKAMTEPTPEMLIAGRADLVAPIGKKNAERVAYHIWQAMMRVAAHEPETEDSNARPTRQRAEPLTD